MPAAAVTWQAVVFAPAASHTDGVEATQGEFRHAETGQLYKAPATTLGAATPVPIGLPGGGRPGTPAEPEDKKSQPVKKSPTEPTDAMGAKVVNDAAAYIRGLAQMRGRNAVWAERAVREAVSLSASEALREKVIDLVARDLPDLLRQIDGRTVQVQGAPRVLQTAGQETVMLLPDWRQRLLAVTANPSLALILLMVGFYGLALEFSSPGFGLPGVTGAISLLLGLFALQLLPVNYAGLALILVGMAFFAAELMSPSFGLLGLGVWWLLLPAAFCCLTAMCRVLGCRCH